MRTALSVLVLCFTSLSTNAQIHYPDEWWPIGTQEFPGAEGYGNAWIHFENGQPSIVPSNLNMNFEATAAVASDTAGHVLFYSNGCEVRNADGTLMTNGDDLNPGALHDWVCANGYTVPRGMLAIPWPGQPSKWVLLHTGGRYDPVRKLTYGPFYYSEIVMNGATGEMISKNNILSDNDLEPFAVVRHANGRDWWIVIPQYGTNSYEMRQLSPGGFSEPAVQEIGPSIGCRRIGSSVFSNDGNRYARTNNCSAVVMNFDRCSGIFSNPVLLERPSFTLGGGGVAFSENNRWLYLTSNLSVFRADLENSAPFPDSLFKQPYFEDESLYVHSTSLGNMQYGPDGKIYIGSQHRERYLTTLSIEEDTFSYGHEALLLPVANVRTMPYFPNFRLYDVPGSACDTLGIDAPVSAVVERPKQMIFNVSPNPASETVNISWQFFGKQAAGVLELYDVHGRSVRRVAIASGAEGQTTLELQGLPKGIYFVRFQTREQVVVRKLVVK